MLRSKREICNVCNFHFVLMNVGNKLINTIAASCQFKTITIEFKRYYYIFTVEEKYKCRQNLTYFSTFLTFIVF